MKSIPEATAITLTNEERSELDGLARSTKTEHRLRQRARIVLLSADGLATRAIGRAVGCTTGTASKWRGGCATPSVGLAASTKPASAATIQNIRRPTTNAFWRRSISQFPPAMRAGPGR